MLICWGLCGSFCTAGRAIDEMQSVVNAGHDVLPVGSFAFLENDTRFGKAADLRHRIETVCGRKMISSLVDAEPVGPVLKPDLAVIAPASGTTLAKLAAGIYDTPVTLAAKAHLRSGRPLLLGIATNDALSGNFENIARLFTRKNIFFVPFFQDDPQNKPFSLVCDFSSIPAAIDAASNQRQLPLFFHG